MNQVYTIVSDILEGSIRKITFDLHTDIKTLEPYLYGQPHKLQNFEDTFIKGTYQVELHYDKLYANTDCPKVFEVGWEILRIKKSCKRQIWDFHLYDQEEWEPTFSFCMFLQIADDYKVSYPNGFNFETLMMNIACHMYCAAGIEKFGIFPMAEYQHGILGHIEYLMENPSDLSEFNRIKKDKSIHRNARVCPCCSKMKIQDCMKVNHSEILDFYLKTFPAPTPTL